MITIYFFFTQVLEDVDTLLFSILILKGLNDSNGKVWRCFPQQLYLVEATYEMLKQVCINIYESYISAFIVLFVCLCTYHQDAEASDTQNCSTIELLKFLPTITCYSPRDAISHVPLKKSTYLP